MFTMVSSSPRRRSLARATLSTRHAPSRARAVASSRFQPFSFPLESRPIDESPSDPTHTRARHARVRGILERSNARARVASSSFVVRRADGRSDGRSFVRRVVSSSRRVVGVFGRDRDRYRARVVLRFIDSSIHSWADAEASNRRRSTRDRPIRDRAIEGVSSDSRSGRARTRTGWRRSGEVERGRERARRGGTRARSVWARRTVRGRGRRRNDRRRSRKRMRR